MFLGSRGFRLLLLDDVMGSGVAFSIRTLIKCPVVILQQPASALSNAIKNGQRANLGLTEYPMNAQLPVLHT
jgi:hypothetical protein